MSLVGRLPGATVVTRLPHDMHQYTVYVFMCMRVFIRVCMHVCVCVCVCVCVQCHRTRGSTQEKAMTWMLQVCTEYGLDSH